MPGSQAHAWGEVCPRPKGFQAEQTEAVVSPQSFQIHCLPLERCTVTYSLFINEEAKAQRGKGTYTKSMASPGCDGI